MVNCAECEKRISTTYFDWRDSYRVCNKFLLLTDHLRTSLVASAQLLQYEKLRSLCKNNIKLAHFYMYAVFVGYNKYKFLEFLS